MESASTVLVSPILSVVNAFGFCLTPGQETKRRALEDLYRQGVGLERMLAAANDPMNHHLDFWQIVSAMKPWMKEKAAEKKKVQQSWEHPKEQGCDHCNGIGWIYTSIYNSATEEQREIVMPCMTCRSQHPNRFINPPWSEVTEEY